MDIINNAKWNGKNWRKIQNVVGQIKDRNSSIKNLNDTEFGVLKNAWGSANDNVKEQILNELEDMTDGKSYIVCPTGVSSRIINANIVEDPGSSPIKEEDLRKEMLNSASKIRADLERSPKFQQLSEEYQIEIFKQKLFDKCNKDYNGIISPERIHKELNVWIDDIY